MSIGRLDALVEELEHMHWDVVVLTETWREETCEEIRLGSGHRFYGSGGTRGCRGVGFLVHARHSRCKFNHINDRVAFIDFNFTPCVRIFGTYMPHSKYPDMEVDIVYEILHELLQQSRRRSISCIIAGDWNAQVGARQERDDTNVLGPHAFQVRNGRGEWLLQWCTTHSLILGNTFYHPGLVRGHTGTVTCIYKMTTY